ncbi:hypothetical protein [Aliidiomarina maris]|uniref:Uncharacterized protein n=1 Tax=Aliidiomarina maris TaxID=531312 RepID=A0A327XBF0_9GAMM|nr:hypothetical protein [Aliidiomarina maris]RAK01566.1 hypothetical protein B0I24_101189 [Aliidiomarina maris]RUO28400.1 hypothetical protein CWE07_00920 [Aliidiomarina maris]
MLKYLLVNGLFVIGLGGALCYQVIMRISNNNPDLGMSWVESWLFFSIIGVALSLFWRMYHHKKPPPARRGQGL